MSRPLRIEYEGAWYHVMNRGAARKKIFYTDEHRKLFLKLLEQIHRKFKVEIHAYCLMSNHYHLLLRTPLANLNQCMRHLNSVYVQLFNRSNNTDGPLFRGRYKAILVESENYLIRLSRYIHLNPVAAEICKKPNEYVWSSYSYYIKDKRKPRWLYCNEVLNQFENQRSEYQLFIQDGIDQETNDLYLKTKKLPIFGSASFINSINEKYLKNRKISPEVSEKKIIDKLFIPTPIQVMQIVSQYYNIPICDIKSSRRGVINIPRLMTIYLVIESCHMTFCQIGNIFGMKTRSGISNIYSRILRKLEIDDKLGEEMKDLINLLEVLMRVGHGTT